MKADVWGAFLCDPNFSDEVCWGEDEVGVHDFEEAATFLLSSGHHKDHSRAARMHLKALTTHEPAFALLHYNEALKLCPSSSVDFIVELLVDRAETLLSMGLHILAGRDANRALQSCASLSCRHRANHVLRQCPPPASGGHESWVGGILAGHPTPASNPTLPGACGEVELRNLDLCGRGLVATSDIQRGAVVVEEEAFAAALLPAWRPLRCHHCLQVTLAPLPCDGCCFAHYCNDTCRALAWAHYHQVECCRQFFALAPASTVLCCRVVCRGHGSGHRSADVPGDFERIVSLMTHEQDLPHRLLGHYRLHAALGSQALEGHLPSLETGLPGTTGHTLQHTLQQTLLRHLCQTRTNTVAITDLITSQQSPGIEKANSRILPTGGLSRLQQVRVGQGMFATTSMLNHACQPNTLMSFKGRHVTVRAADHIPPGSQLCNCYGPHVGHMNVLERQGCLLRQYFFQCGCEACVREAVTGETSPGATPRTSRTRLKTVDGKSRRKSSGESRMERGGGTQETLQQADALFHTGTIALDALDEESVGEMQRGMMQGGMPVPQHVLSPDVQVEAALQALQSALDIYQRSQPHAHRTAQTHDLIAQAYSFQGNFHQASMHCQQSIDILQHIFGIDSIEMANEYSKLAHLYFNGMQPHLAKDFAIKALPIFAEMYGSDCLEAKDLCEMIMVIDECVP